MWSPRAGWASALVLLTFTLGSCAGRRGAEASAHVSSAEGQPDGAALYAQYCALCHGADREGYAADNAPSLRSMELYDAAPLSFVWMTISYGRPGTPMAAFSVEQGGPLDHDAQHRLVEWLVKESGVKRPKPIVAATVAGDVARGEQVYAERCASCHGAQGEGVNAPALANPVLLATASDTLLRDVITRGRAGTPMVAYADQLSPQAIDDVTAFLRSRAAGWSTPAPVVLRPPDLTAAVQNAAAPSAVFTAREGRFVAADEVVAAMRSQARLVLLDARPTSDWQQGHIPGALPVPFYDGVEAILPHLPRDGTPVIVYCACPHAASGKIVDALRAEGLSEAYVLDEGVLIWA
ncbi:MAG: hypothetical protein RIT28_1780, partial [Pseudomonadota bacterium]